MRAAAGKGLLKMGTFKTSAATIAVAATLTFSISLPATAQDDTGSVSSYRLPDPTRTQAPAPRAAGPVDPETPSPRPSSTPSEDAQPAVIAAPNPAATNAPRITPPALQPRAAPTTVQRTARPASTSPAPTPNATPTVRQTTDREPTAANVPVPVASEAVIAHTPIQTSQPSVDATFTPDEATAAASTPVENEWLVPGLVGAGILAVGVFAFSRRRRKEQTAIEPETEPYSAPDTPVPAPKPVPVQQPVAAPAPTPTPAPQPVQAPIATAASQETQNSLAIGAIFTPTAVRLSLVYATVQYELEVVNEGPQTLPELRVLADLGSAHASLSTQEQLAPSPAHMEAQHAVPPLAAGASVLLKGEVRVPLQVMPTLVKGEARFFVPLVRFVLVGNDGNAARRVFTLGPIAADGITITPVRLDSGPRNLRELASREIEEARGFGIAP